MKNRMKKLPMYLIALVLILGATAGAGIWLLNANVPIEYDDPYVISMSQYEVTSYNWNVLPYRDVTTTEMAYFNETGSGLFYHQYVRIVNPAGADEINVQFNVTEPTAFSDDMGFTYMAGIVEPGDEGEATVDAWGTYGNNVTVSGGSTVYFTIIYTLGPDVPTSNNYQVSWTFSDITNEP